MPQSLKDALRETAVAVAAAKQAEERRVASETIAREKKERRERIKRQKDELPGKLRECFRQAALKGEQEFKFQVDDTDPEVVKFLMEEFSDLSPTHRNVEVVYGREWAAFIIFSW